MEEKMSRKLEKEVTGGQLAGFYEPQFAEVAAEFVKNFDEYFKSFGFLGQTPLGAVYSAISAKNNIPTLHTMGMTLEKTPPSTRTIPLNVPITNMNQHIHHYIFCIYRVLILHKHELLLFHRIHYMW